MVITDLCLPSSLNLSSHWLKAPLNSINPNCQSVDQIEALGVLGQDGSERTGDNVSKFPWMLTRQKPTSQD